jgi:hypothetical protein
LATILACCHYFATEQLSGAYIGMFLSRSLHFFVHLQTGDLLILSDFIYAQASVFYWLQGGCHGLALHGSAVLREG